MFIWAKNFRDIEIKHAFLSKPFFHLSNAFHISCHSLFKADDETDYSNYGLIPVLPCFSTQVATVPLRVMMKMTLGTTGRLLF